MVPIWPLQGRVLKAVYCGHILVWNVSIMNGTVMAVHERGILVMC